MSITSSRPILDALFYLYLTIGIAVIIVVLSILTYFVFKYRAKSGQKEPEDAPRAGVIPPLRGSTKVAWAIAIICTLLLIPITIGTLDKVKYIERPPAQETLYIKVEGFQYKWVFTYPNRLKTTGELVVPKDEVIILEVTAGDVMHNFYVPSFRLMKDAIPGKTNIVWFKALSSGKYDAHCNELCGTGHTFMKAKVIVKEPEEFKKWYVGGK